MTNCVYGICLVLYPAVRTVPGHWYVPAECVQLGMHVPAAANLHFFSIIRRALQGACAHCLSRDTLAALSCSCLSLQHEFLTYLLTGTECILQVPNGNKRESSHPKAGCSSMVGTAVCLCCDISRWIAQFWDCPGGCCVLLGMQRHVPPGVAQLGVYHVWLGQAPIGQHTGSFNSVAPVGAIKDFICIVASRHMQSTQSPSIVAVCRQSVASLWALRADSLQ